MVNETARTRRLVIRWIKVTVFDTHYGSLRSLQSMHRERQDNHRQRHPARETQGQTPMLGTGGLDLRKGFAFALHQSRIPARMQVGFHFADDLAAVCRHVDASLTALMTAFMSMFWTSCV